MAQAAKSRWMPLLVGVFGLAIFCIAATVLVREIQSTSLDEISRQFNQIPATNFALAALFTVVSYFALVCFDVLALRYLRVELAFRSIAPIAFSAFAVGHNVGVASLSGGAIRYRAYSLAGLTATQIAALIAFIPLTFVMGVVFLLGIVFVVDPETALSALPFSALTLRTVGLLLFLFIAAYLAVLASYKKPIQIKGWAVELPSLKIGAYQVLLSSFDLLAASLVLFVLLRASVEISYFVVMAAFVLALVVGVISTVPGGLGVFESTLVLLLPEVPLQVLLGAVLAYRLMYYLLPLLAALAIIVLREGFEHRHRIQEITDVGLEWGTRLVPQAIGVAVFVTGAYLLVRGSLPLQASPQGLIELVIPLQVLEMSHLLSSAIGTGFLLIARGLYRRLHRAWLATVALLCVAIAASLLQYHGAISVASLSVILLVTWLSRAEFHRGKRLLDQSFDSSWVSSILLVLIAVLGIGFLANRNIEYSNDLWWQFSIAGEASRMMRALFLAFLLLGGFALIKFLRGRGDGENMPNVEELSRMKSLLSVDRASFSNIALLGDKRFLWHPTNEAFLMYQISGGSWIVLSDPIGREECFEELLWQFKEVCDANSARCVFYQVSSDYLSLYIDLGLSFLKLGEEGVVNLEEFGTEGSSRAELRQALSKAKRNAAEFVVIPASEVVGIMDELERVSKDWLQGKTADEKGFSLGYFDRQYLQNFDCAVVKVNGEIVAFANIWKGGTGLELSIDLMRYNEKAPKGIMDYLFIEMMLWGKQNGYKEFSLGMAPLSGLESHELATSWHKLGNLIFRFGDHFYNFEGLRNYKQKFEPQWEPRFLACKGGISMPAVLLDTTVLISGGYRGILS